MSRVFSGDSFQQWLFIKKDDTNHPANDGVRKDITPMKMGSLSPSLEWLTVVRNGWAKEGGKIDWLDSTKMLVSGFLQWRDMVVGNDL